MKNGVASIKEAEIANKLFICRRKETKETEKVLIAKSV